jgi:hypothetical protein
MTTLNRLFLVLSVVLVLGGAVFLLTWEIPPPTSTIERVIPDEQLPR